MSGKWHGGKGDIPRNSTISREEKDIRHDLAFGNTPALNKCSCGNGVQLVNTIVRCAKCKKTATGHTDKEATIRWNYLNE
jgi:hypothetical protein